MGYCASKYLSYTKPAVYQPDDTAIYDPTLREVSLWTAEINSTDQEELPIFKWCSLQAPEVIKVPFGITVELVELGDIWCKIKYEGETGYCLIRDLKIISPV